jgi:DNA polymerase II small subunit/DNA polymerase delta subunit B
LGLLSHPDVLKKAQQEIDAVVKPGQLPDFDDEDSLPYITAIVKETLRWRDVLPICEKPCFLIVFRFSDELICTAIPHYLHVEDEYKGYRLPAGSIIVPNAW